MQVPSDYPFQERVRIAAVPPQTPQVAPRSGQDRLLRLRVDHVLDVVVGEHFDGFRSRESPGLASRYCPKRVVVALRVRDGYSRDRRCNPIE